MAAAIVRAFERHGGPAWNVTAMRGSNNYIDYPEIERWDPVLFMELYQQAHLIHGMERLRNVEQAIGHQLDKPAVLHHHGTEFRDNPNLAMHAMSRGWRQLASTVDLCRIHPLVEWLPNPIPIEWLELFRSQYAPRARARAFLIGHMPTQRHMKGTNIFDQAIAACPPNVVPFVVEYQPWVVSLAAKAKCHAYFDQLLYGFGLSALEAWAMGLPVISGVLDPTLLEYMLQTWGSIPFIDVKNAQNITSVITRLAEDPAYYAEWAERGSTYVRTWHDERKVVEQLKNIWAEVIRGR